MADPIVILALRRTRDKISGVIAHFFQSDNAVGTARKMPPSFD
jgi:hypothetical protein